jgi:hypothetical protein
MPYSIQFTAPDLVDGWGYALQEVMPYERYAIRVLG